MMGIRPLFSTGLKHRCFASSSAHKVNNNGSVASFQRKATGILTLNNPRVYPSSFTCRTFRSTSTPCIEISDECDEYELVDFTNNGSSNISRDLSAMVRNRQGGGNTADILSIRKQKMVATGQRSLPALLMTEQLVRLQRESRRLESMFSAMTPPGDLISEYLSLKYAWIEHQLVTCATSIIEANLEYSRIKNAQLQRLEDRFSALVNCISHYDALLCMTERTLKVSQLESDISALTLSTSSLTEEIGEFLRPCISARKKIDDVLEIVNSLEDYYGDLRRIFRTAESNLILIHMEISSLTNDRRYFTPTVREIFRYHYMAIGRVISQTMEFSHQFRSYHYRRKLSEGPLSRAWYPQLLCTYALPKSAKDMKSKSRRDSILALISSGKSPRSSPGAVTVLPRTYRKALQRFYLSRLGRKGPSSNLLLNIYWRQLDVVAPFDLVRSSASILSKVLLDLTKSLATVNGDEWSNLNIDSRIMFRERNKRLFRRFNDHRFEFLSEYRSLVHINWLRLESENKLYALGERKLFGEVLSPPRNLSKDIRAFLRWTRQYAAYEVDVSFLTGKDRQTSIFNIVDDLQLPHEQRQICSDIMLDYGSETAPLPSGRAAARMRGHTNTGLRIRPLLKSLLRGAKIKPPVRAVNRVVVKHPDQKPGKISDKKPDEKAGKRQGKIPDKISDRGNAITPWKSQEHQHSGVIRNSAPGTDKRRTSIKHFGRGGYGQPNRPHREPLISQQQQRQGKRKTEIRNSPPLAREPVNFGKFSFTRSYSSGPAVLHIGATECGNCDSSLVPGSGSSTTPPTGLGDEEGYQQNHTLSGLKGIHARSISRSSCVSEDHLRTPRFWSHHLYKRPGGKSIIVHYCKSLERTEQVARYFLKSPVVGFDIEWKSQASLADGIQNNLSLIQLANEERIALFQIALFKPAKTLDDLVAPSLKRLLESSDIMKVGVSIRADSTRLRKFLGIDAHGLLELSHLYKLVKYSQSNPKMVNKRLVNLSLQVEEHLGLPLDKDDDVRRSDWTRALDYSQVQCTSE